MDLFQLKHEAIRKLHLDLCTLHVSHSFRARMIGSYLYASALKTAQRAVPGNGAALYMEMIQMEFGHLLHMGVAGAEAGSGRGPLALVVLVVSFTIRGIAVHGAFKFRFRAYITGDGGQRSRHVGLADQEAQRRSWLSANADVHAARTIQAQGAPASARPPAAGADTARQMNSSSRPKNFRKISDVTGSQRVRPKGSPGAKISAFFSWSGPAGPVRIKNDLRKCALNVWGSRRASPPVVTLPFAPGIFFFHHARHRPASNRPVTTPPAQGASPRAFHPRLRYVEPTAPVRGFRVRARCGEQGAGAWLERQFGTRKDGLLQFTHQGPTLEAVVPLPRRYITGQEGQNVIFKLKKWVDDLTEAGEAAIKAAAFEAVEKFEVLSF
ncbi:hypothetical protein GGX14DRAFT_594549 [Mycena pura]|uniref:Uncharacterized protein n=1 Tax=Mycena pura TaxID=153505 RepID=A0AAD6XZR6_9AGAR|nr:hypothetical protein GGX14DRAFT_594549 [Mycena pura]